MTKKISIHNAFKDFLDSKLSNSRHVKGADIDKLREAIFKSEELENKETCIALFIGEFGYLPKPNFFERIKAKLF